MQHCAYNYADSIEELCRRGLDAHHVVDGSVPERSLNYLISECAPYIPTRNARVLHVGNFVGVSLCYIANFLRSHSPAAVTVAIDPNVVHRNVTNPQQHVAHLLSRYDLQAGIVIMAGYSLEKCVSNDGRDFGYNPQAHFNEEHAVEFQLKNLLSLCGAVFDLAVIDGNHSGNYLARELAEIDSLLKPGGVVALDDANEAWPAVRRAYDSLDRNRYGEIGNDGRVGILRKLLRDGA